MVWLARELSRRVNLYNPDRNNFAPRFGFAYSPKTLRSRRQTCDSRRRRHLATTAFRKSSSQTRAAIRRSSRVIQICCGTAATDFGSPFAGGQILYALGSSNSPFSYPANPALAVGIDPATGTPPNRTVEIYGALADTPTAYVYTYSFDTQYALPYNLDGDSRLPGQLESQVDSSRESTLRATCDSGKLLRVCGVHSDA